MPQNPQPDQPKKSEVHFYHQKSALFRVVHTDGVWCSVGPHGNLHLIFFSERLAIPTETAYHLRPDGELGDENLDKRKGKPDYIREMEIDVVLNWKNVVNLHTFLGQYIEANKAK